MPQRFCQRATSHSGCDQPSAGCVIFNSARSFWVSSCFAQIAAQNGVHKTGLGAKTVLLGQFDGFMDGGVVGNPVEPENLVKAEPQQILQGRFLFPPVGFPGDEPVERGLPAHDAVSDFLAKAAVGGRKRRAVQRGFEQILNESAARAPLLQNARRDLSWFLSAHQF